MGNVPLSSRRTAPVAAVQPPSSILQKVPPEGACTVSFSDVSPTTASSRRALFDNPDASKAIFAFLQGVSELRALATIGIVLDETLWEDCAKREWPVLTSEALRLALASCSWRALTLRRMMAQKGPRPLPHKSIDVGIRQRPSSGLSLSHPTE